MKILFLLSLIFLASCSDLKRKGESIPQNDNEPHFHSDTSKFLPYKYDLYLTKDGILAYKTIDRSFSGEPEPRFVTSIYCDTITEDQKPLIEIIDTATFKHIGDLYYKDKKHVYYHHRMLDGGPFFIVWDANPQTFHVLDNSYYGKDDAHVFWSGNIMEEVDHKSFKVISKDSFCYGWTAKDKNHIYEGYDIVKSDKKQ